MTQDQAPAPRRGFLVGWRKALAAINAKNEREDLPIEVVVTRRVIFLKEIEDLKENRQKKEAELTRENVKDK